VHLGFVYPDDRPRAPGRMSVKRVAREGVRQGGVGVRNDPLTMGRSGVLVKAGARVIGNRPLHPD